MVFFGHFRMDVDHSGRYLAQKFYGIRDPDYYEFEGKNKLSKKILKSNFQASLAFQETKILIVYVLECMFCLYVQIIKNIVFNKLSYIQNQIL